VSGDLPEAAPFEAGRFPVEVIVVWDDGGGWHAATVYYRTTGGPVTVHPEWPEPLSWVTNPWEYFSERLRDGQGGNGYNYDVWGFEVAAPDDIAAVVSAWEADVQAKGSPFPQFVAGLSFIGASHAGDSGPDPQQVVSNEEVDLPSADEAPMEAIPAVLVTRRPPPQWLRSVVPDAAREAVIAKEGEGPGWGYAIPGLFRTLAAPLTFEPMPALGNPSERHPDALGYWAALYHMLIYSLGWARPDRGLRWWYDTGRPTDDPRLALLDQVWRRDGHLEDFALWVCRSTRAIPFHQLGEVTGYRDDGLPVEPHPDWLSGARGGAKSLFDGGGDVYHLTDHRSAPLAEPRGKPLLLRSGAADRRAVLVVDSMVGWYRALVTETAKLPPLHDRSWYVDVVVRPVGWLGTYRRSRASGLWFSGRHRHHTPGT
jgi:hypothetical protein